MAKLPARYRALVLMATFTQLRFALDGTGPYSGPLASTEHGPVPPVHGLPSRDVDPGLLIPAPHPEYKLKVRWYTRLDEDNCFARWLLTPAQASHLTSRRV